MRKKTILLALPQILALASPAQADDHKALLAKCDIDRNGVINAPANKLPPQAWATIEQEQVCQHEFELDQLAKDIPDIRKRCDLNDNGRIDHYMPLIAPVMMAGKETKGRQAWRNLPEDVRKPVDAERKCVTDAEIAKDKEKIARLDANIARQVDDYKKMVQILAMLDPAEAKAYLAKEITETEKVLQQAKQDNQESWIKDREDKLQFLREQQKSLK